MQRLVVSLTKSNEYNRIELKLNFVVFPFTVGNNFSEIEQQWLKLCRKYTI